MRRKDFLCFLGFLALSLFIFLGAGRVELAPSTTAGGGGSGTANESSAEFSWADFTEYSTLLTGFTSSTSQYWNPSVGADNVTIVYMRMYLAQTSGVTDNNTWRLALYSDDTGNGDSEVKSWNAQLPISGVSSINRYPSDELPSGTTVVPLFDSDGLTQYGKIVLGTDSDSGTTEVKHIHSTVEAINTGLAGISNYPTSNAYAHNQSVSGVWEITLDVTSYDLDNSSELHFSLRPLSAPSSGVSAYIIVRTK